jgi:hypothetical protein
VAADRRCKPPCGFSWCCRLVGTSVAIDRSVLELDLATRWMAAQTSSAMHSEAPSRPADLNRSDESNLAEAVTGSKQRYSHLHKSTPGVVIGQGMALGRARRWRGKIDDAGPTQRRCAAWGRGTLPKFARTNQTGRKTSRALPDSEGRIGFAQRRIGGMWTIAPSFAADSSTVQQPRIAPQTCSATCDPAAGQGKRSVPLPYPASRWGRKLERRANALRDGTATTQERRQE